MSRYLVDSNVFLYARGKQHPYRAPCRAVLRAAAQGHVTLEASVEVVQEFTHVLLRRGVERSSALDESDEVRSQCRLHAFDADVLVLALGLLATHDSLDVRDAVHAATAIHSGVSRILSADRVFDDVAGVTRVDPAASGTPWAADADG